MTIAPETIDQIRLSTDIVELVREYLPSLKKSGRNWKANCPFHNEKTPSFMVNAEKGIYHCFGCHAGGDVFKFIMQIDGLTWPEAIRKLAQRAGIVVKESQEDVVRRSDRQKIFDLLEHAANFYHRSLMESREGAQVRAYLEKRGVNNESLERFLIGYSSRDGIVQAALKKGYTHEQLIAAGLITRTERGTYYEYMSERAVFPIWDTQGHIVAFGGRTLKDQHPKYLNSPETAVYSKSAQLYGLFQALPHLRQVKEAIILEGYMDVVITQQYGIGNTVATLGTAFTAQHAKILNRYCEKVTLLFDADAAGNQAARRAIETLVETDITLRVVNLPDGVDPDEYIVQNDKEGFTSYITHKETSAIEFLTQQALLTWGKNTPEAKVRAVTELLPVLNKVKNSILKREWVKHLAERLQISEESILTEDKRFGAPARSKTAKTAVKQSEKTGGAVRSAEEEIIQIVFAHPEHAALVPDDVFVLERNRRVYALLKSGVQSSQIVNQLDDNDAAWFTELLLEEKSYTAPDQVLTALLKDVNSRSLEVQRQELEKEVIQMINGKIPANEYKIQRYRDLNRQLKGSAKS